MQQYPHKPVMVRQILSSFQQTLVGPNPSYLDCTFGRGGHWLALLKKAPQLQTVALDQDLQAIDFAKENYSSQISSGQLQLHHSRFSEWIPEPGSFDMILADLGVSSPQLDQAERGFSFNKDGPLDMRMNQAEGLTARDLIMELPEGELIRVFQDYGEVSKPFRVVRAIVHDRKTKSFDSTLELAQLIERVDGWRKKGIHPATNYFMALRIAVNQELASLEEALPKWILGLRPMGRLAVLTFHSLEDRIVKNVFRSSELGQPVYKKVLVADDEELSENPRARSAKLRVFERSQDDAEVGPRAGKFKTLP